MTVYVSFTGVSSFFFSDKTLLTPAPVLSALTGFEIQ